MVCKLAQISPEIWMTLPLEAKKWLLNERKHQQQEEDKIKKSLALSKSIAVTNHKDSNNDDVIKDNTDQTYDFVDEFLEEVMKISSI
jgi:hypothetical protein